MKLKPVDKKRFILHTIKSNCELQEFVENTLDNKCKFKRGSVFYEFTHAVENVTGNKELVFMNKVHGCYTCFHDIYVNVHFNVAVRGIFFSKC